MEQPSEAKKTEQAVALLLLFLIIIIGLIYAPYIGINPQLGTLKEKNLEAAVKKTDLRAKEQQVGNLKELESKIKATQSTVKKLAIALPNEAEVAEILVQVQAMASSSGVNITALSPSKEEILASVVAENEEVTTEGDMVSVEPTVEKYSFTMSVEGSYDSIMKFLKAVENNLRPVKIIKADLAGGGGGNPTIATSFVMEAYYQK